MIYTYIYIYNIYIYNIYIYIFENCCFAAAKHPKNLSNSDQNNDARSKKRFQRQLVSTERFMCNEMLIPEILEWCDGYKVH